MFRFYILVIYLLVSIKLCFNVGCTDTPSWDNGYGQDCSLYGTRYCENGAAKPGHEADLGAKYNYPENNCCVCGKGNFSNNQRDLNYIFKYNLINFWKLL